MHGRERHGGWKWGKTETPGDRVTRCVLFYRGKPRAVALQRDALVKLRDGGLCSLAV